MEEVFDFVGPGGGVAEVGLAEVGEFGEVGGEGGGGLDVVVGSGGDEVGEVEAGELGEGGAGDEGVGAPTDACDEGCG